MLERWPQSDHDVEDVDGDDGQAEVGGAVGMSAVDAAAGGEYEAAERLRVAGVVGGEVVAVGLGGWISGGLLACRAVAARSPRTLPLRLCLYDQIAVIAAFARSGKGAGFRDAAEGSGRVRGGSAARSSVRDATTPDDSTPDGCPGRP